MGESFTTSKAPLGDGTSMARSTQFAVTTCSSIPDSTSSPPPSCGCSICPLFHMADDYCSIDLDAPIIVGHVERNRGHIEQPHEGSGEDVLSGMLLHVVTATGGVDLAMDAASGLEVSERRFEVVNDSPVFRVGHFGDAEFLATGNNPTRVVDLAAAGGIEGRAIKDYGRTVSSGKLFDFGIEVVKEGIVVVEAVGHGLGIYLTIQNGCEALWREPGQRSTRSFD